MVQQENLCRVWQPAAAVCRNCCNDGSAARFVVLPFSLLRFLALVNRKTLFNPVGVKTGRQDQHA
jgi:hypothetical protein